MLSNGTEGQCKIRVQIKTDEYIDREEDKKVWTILTSITFIPPFQCT